MTRKHFEQIAEILRIRDAGPNMIRAFADMCAEHNEHFKKGRFYEACGLDPHA
jgi:hypothetical protein